MNTPPHLAEVDAARIWAVQGQFFPLSPRTVCEAIGLNWWAALKLHEDGWLSFNPETTPELDEAQEAELSFVGALVVAGCDARMLERLLTPLTKPYYRLSRIYYDWAAQAWRLLPIAKEPTPEADFAELLGALKPLENCNN